MSLHEMMSRTRFFDVIAVVTVLAGCGGGDEVHALGDTVTVGYNDRTDTGQRGVDTTLEVTVLAVRTGSQDDLTDAGFEVDPEDRDATPYYVDVRYENTGDGTVERNVAVSLEDPDGNLIGSTVVFDYGDEGFPPCESVDEGTFAPGDGFESCTLFLVPEDVEVGRVSFLSDEGADAEPEFVFWDVE
ncbi:MAG: hypothetical protein M3271_05890 [Actinomycetota bacterium]|nr:hypothetical protein [Actinomycetota bacterium]